MPRVWRLTFLFPIHFFTLGSFNHHFSITIIEGFMLTSFKIQFGDIVKSISFPIPFSSASLEESIQVAFKLKDKSILGLRYPLSEEILFLDELATKEMFLEVLKDTEKPLLLVFHSEI